MSIKKRKIYLFLSCDFLIIFTTNEEKGKRINGRKHNMKWATLWSEKKKRDEKRETFVLSSRFYVDQCDRGTEDNPH